MNINNSTQKTMQSTQMDYEISSPHSIHTQYTLHNFCCTLLKPERKLVVWLEWSLTLLLLYPVLVLVPHAPGPRPAPGHLPHCWLGTLVTGHSMCGWVPVCRWSWCCSVQWGCCWLTREAAVHRGHRTRQPCHSRPCPCSLHHHHTSPSTPSHQQKTSTNIFWGQIFLGLSLKLIWNSHNKDF